ncbi:DUF262 domain-containing protein [Mycoplasma todarodis]|uniref:DUF262 domain-containing protein n=1 Tax=Mycoplasma todarodis TaxID=1937191 RepID=A0A4R0XY10_9MOLU|nr:DUF262 domain-containing protein [Mycoplasma todarodis]TCG11938.1 hypothetical protein C4B25_00340 [Mycoplasma todarodis]
MTKLDIHKRMLFEFNSKNNNSDKRLEVNLGQLEVPTYQRRYEWKDKNIDFIFEELKDFISNFKHDYQYMLANGGNINLFSKNSLEQQRSGIYLGNIVITKTQNDEPFQIIDGQQRLTTIYIFLKVFQHIQQEIINNDVDANILKGAPFKTIWNLLSRTLTFDGTTGEISPSIRSLNKLDKEALEALHESKTTEEFEQKINNNSRYFKTYQKIIKEVNELTNTDKIYTLYGLLTIELGVVLVDDESMAFDLFEKLNSRGMALSQSDLIKNLFLKELSKSNTSNKEALWDSIIDDIKEGEKINSATITNFFRWVMMIDKKSYIKKKELFNEYSTKIKEGLEAKSLLDMLSSYANTYKEYFIQKTATYEEIKIKHDVERAFLTSPMIYKPLFLLFADLFKRELVNEDVFAKVINYLEKQAFLHFTINNLPSKEIDREIPRIIFDINNHIENNALNIENIFKTLDKRLMSWTLRNVQGKIEELYSPLTNTDFDKRQHILQLYKLINNFKTQNTFRESTELIEDGNIDVEHLLPKDTQYWITKECDDELLQKHNKKIGNIFIISGSINKGISNKSYLDKLNSEDYLSFSKKKTHSLNDSKLFKEQMLDAFESIPQIWNIEMIGKRTDSIVKFLQKNSILNPKNYF